MLERPPSRRAGQADAERRVVPVGSAGVGVGRCLRRRRRKALRETR